MLRDPKLTPGCNPIRQVNSHHLGTALSAIMLTQITELFGCNGDRNLSCRRAFRRSLPDRQHSSSIFSFIEWLDISDNPKTSTEVIRRISVTSLKALFHFFFEHYYSFMNGPRFAILGINCKTETLLLHKTV